jgi:hypothetical protein
MGATTVILIVSIWLIFILFLCALVRSGAIREREQYDQLLSALKQVRANTASELRYWETQSSRSVTGGNIKSNRADWPDAHEGRRPEQSAML